MEFSSFVFEYLSNKLSEFVNVFYKDDEDNENITHVHFVEPTNKIIFNFSTLKTDNSDYYQSEVYSNTATINLTEKFPYYMKIHDSRGYWSETPNTIQEDQLYSKKNTKLLDSFSESVILSDEEKLYNSTDDMKNIIVIDEEESELIFKDYTREINENYEFILNDTIETEYEMINM